MDKLRIECEHLVAIPVGIKMFQHVIFKATEASKNAIRAAVREGQTYQLSVKDVSGDFVTQRDHTFVSVEQSHGTLILTTREV